MQAPIDSTNSVNKQADVAKTMNDLFDKFSVIETVLNTLKAGVEEQSKKEKDSQNKISDLDMKVNAWKNKTKSFEQEIEDLKEALKRLEANEKAKFFYEMLYSELETTIDALFCFIGNKKLLNKKNRAKASGSIIVENPITESFDEERGVFETNCDESRLIEKYQKNLALIQPNFDEDLYKIVEPVVRKIAISYEEQITCITDKKNIYTLIEAVIYRFCSYLQNINAFQSKIKFFQTDNIDEKQWATRMYIYEAIIQSKAKDNIKIQVYCVEYSNKTPIRKDWLISEFFRQPGVKVQCWKDKNKVHYYMRNDVNRKIYFYIWSSSKSVKYLRESDQLVPKEKGKKSVSRPIDVIDPLTIKDNDHTPLSSFRFVLPSSRFYVYS